MELHAPARPDITKRGAARRTLARAGNEKVSALPDLSGMDSASLFRALRTTADGLTESDAALRLQETGLNRIGTQGTPTILSELVARARNPLNALLLMLAIVSYSLGDSRAALVIAVIVLLSILTAFIQEHRSNKAAAELQALVKNMAAVKRRDDEGAAADAEGFREILMEELVHGDIVRLAAGDMMPGDLRLLSAKDLFVNQSALTGEAMPIEKFPAPDADRPDDPFDLQNICFMGSNVVSGYGEGVILRTGRGTYFGRLAESIEDARELTAFDQGVTRFTWVMLRFILVMAPAVFVINGVTKGDWLEALLFAVAVAVGLTPEMLPMIVTVNLAKGAITMSHKRVIVKRLNAIQNFGAMDVLCADKTGTLTQDKVILKQYLDLAGQESARVLEYAYLNSHHQSGLRNLLDLAVLSHIELHERFGDESSYRKIDEIPFDFTRRRLSVVLAHEDRHVLICKGAVEEIFAVSARYTLDGEQGDLDPSHFEKARQESIALNEDGFRVIAVAYREFDQSRQDYSVADERDLTLLGYIAFLDPPKESAAAALKALAASGVTVKILTGDNEVITRKICKEVGLDPGEIVLGPEIERLDDDALAAMAETTTVFAKLAPEQKARIIDALHCRGHVIGYLGDGINDSPALKKADVGISVDSAVDIAKESADIILLEKSLTVLQQGVVEGRKVFGNIVKYIKMGASSNFGNMFSVLGASIFLPFLPMTPIQVLTNNLLYDFSQTAIPADNVDAEYLETPRRWDIGNIFKFVVLLGPVSSIFDYATYFTMLYLFDAWTRPALFQTGWFVESLLTQTLIIHIIRTARIPFVESRASGALLTMSAAVALIGIALPFTPLGHVLGFVSLPPLYWPVILSFLLSYAVLAHLAKSWFVKRWGI